MDTRFSSSRGDAPTGPALPLRFVVLHHTGIVDPHYDFMIESVPGGPLYTWRCHHPQIPSENGTTSAWRLRNHRASYLQYEGPISGNRGHVSRIASGRCAFYRRNFRSWIFVPDQSLYPAYCVGPLWAYPSDRSAPLRIVWCIEGLPGHVIEPDQPTAR